MRLRRNISVIFHILQKKLRVKHIDALSYRIDYMHYPRVSVVIFDLPYSYISSAASVALCHISVFGSKARRYNVTDLRRNNVKLLCKLINALIRSLDFIFRSPHFALLSFSAHIIHQKSEKVKFNKGQRKSKSDFRFFTTP